MIEGFFDNLCVHLCMPEHDKESSPAVLRSVSQ